MPQPTDPSSPEISALLNEDRTFPPSAAFTAAAHANDPGVYARAAADPEAFWAGFAGELEWIDAVARRCSSGSRRTRSGSSAAS